MQGKILKMDVRYVASMFLLVVGIRMFFVGLFGTDLPFADDWHIFPFNLFQPYLSNRLSISDLAFSFAGHRLFLSNLLNLGTFVLNNGWSPILTLIVQMFPYGLSAALIVFAHLQFFRRMGLLSYLIVLLIFAAPLAWENFLAIGFSGILVFLAILAFYLASRPEISFGSLIGVLILSFLAAISAGPGYSVSLIVGVVFLFRATQSKAARRKEIILGLVFMALAYLLSLLGIPDSGFDYIRTESLGSFLLSLERYMSWPGKGLGLLLVWLPALLFFCALLFRKQTPEPGVLFAFGCLLWVALIDVGGSIFRGAAGQGPAVRYGDQIVIGFLAGLFLVDSFPIRMNKTAQTTIANIFSTIIQGRAKWFYGYKIAIIVVLIGFSISAPHHMRNDLVRKQEILTYMKEAVREEQVQGGAFLKIRNGVPLKTIPSYDKELLVRALESYPLRFFLPVEFRPWMEVEPSDSAIMETASVPVPLVRRKLISSYVGGTAWTGEIRSQQISISNTQLLLRCAGEMLSDGTGINITILPLGKTIVVSGGVLKDSAESWQSYRISLPAGTQAIQLAVEDRSEKAWIAVGGIEFVSNTDPARQRWSLIGAFVAIIGTAILIRSALFGVKESKSIKNE